ncbi:MAG: hypothetical protein ABIH34_00760 [Nanoarchaeota archaeon]
MVEFNPDGSLKLPERFEKREKENVHRMNHGHCIKIKREVLSFDAPKKCMLYLTLSRKMTDDRFVNTIFNYFKEDARTPTKIDKKEEKEIEITIGTDFRRCTDCQTLRNRFREFMNDNVIEERGNCTFEGRKTFVYEDYFE